MFELRFGQAAVLLDDGRVLIVGGTGGSELIPDSEIFDPVSNTWEFGGRNVNRRGFATGTLLPDGRVIVVGGSGDSDIRPALRCGIRQAARGVRWRGWLPEGQDTRPRYSLMTGC